MQVYTVHLPRGATPGDPAAFERAVLVRDGFSVWAFLFSVLYFASHRHWLAALGVFVALAGFAALVGALDLTPWATLGAHILASSLVGLEASSLRRWSLQRRGMPLIDVVSGAGPEEAEAKACARWLARAEPAASVTGEAARPAYASAQPRDSGVIGLFPERAR
ncbi:MAG: DUF2628 domain-containing protein [Salinarimonadaceae bacterium]|nr:MAG: DUF2628 domain-containing protein [Salinarimonadaceae bacterium]